jgi:hypothetical protein
VCRTSVVQPMGPPHLDACQSGAGALRLDSVNHDACVSAPDPDQFLQELPKDHDGATPGQAQLDGIRLGIGYSGRDALSALLATQADRLDANLLQGRRERPSSVFRCLRTRQGND